MSILTLGQQTDPASDPWACRLLAARGGASAARERLFRELRPWWLALAWRVLHDREEAQDAVQEAFLRLLLRLDRFDTAKCRRATNWLARVLINRAIEHLRRRRRAVPLLDLDAPARPEEGPAEAAERREQSARLRALLGELAPRDREALLLRFEQGLKYQRIGRRLGVSTSVAYRIVNKALDRLARRVRSNERAA